MPDTQYCRRILAEVEGQTLAIDRNPEDQHEPFSLFCGTENDGVRLWFQPDMARLIAAALLEEAGGAPALLLPCGHPACAATEPPACAFCGYESRIARLVEESLGLRAELATWQQKYSDARALFEAVGDGEQAGRAGEPKRTNPHTGALAVGWERGWRAGQRERLEAENKRLRRDLRTAQGMLADAVAHGREETDRWRAASYEADVMHAKAENFERRCAEVETERDRWRAAADEYRDLAQAFAAYTSPLIAAEEAHGELWAPAACEVPAGPCGCWEG